MDNRVYREEDPAYLKMHSFETTVTVETPHHDSNAADWVQAFYCVMIGMTFHPLSVIGAMKDFVDEHSFEFKNSENDDSEDKDDLAI